MISDREVKEAVEVCDANKYGNEQLTTDEVKHLEVLISLAQSYLSAEMPEEQELPQKPDGHLSVCGCISCSFRSRIEERNETIKLCRLASVKDKMRMEELEGALRKIVENCHHHKTETSSRIYTIARSALANVKQGREG